MGREIKSYGVEGREDLLKFDPATLVIVEDEGVEDPHPLYDERAALAVSESLVRNIMVHGVLEPVLVRANGKRDDGSFIVEVIDGRQRVRAAREANRRLAAEGKELVRVPAVRKRGSDADIFGMLISANEHRQSDGPLVRAKKLARLLGMGKTREEACVLFGVSNVTAGRLLALLECSPKVQAAVAHGTVSLEVARTLADLPRAEQNAKLTKLLATGATRGAKGARAAREVTGKKARAPRMLTRGEVLILRDRLVDIAHRGEVEPEASRVLDYVLGDDGAIARHFVKGLR